MSTEENKAIVRRHYEELWANGDLAVADEIYSSDCVGHCGNFPDQTGYPESEKAIIARELATFPDGRPTVEDQIAEGDKVLTRWQIHCTHDGPFYGHPPTGIKITASGFHLHRLSGGKIVEVWALGDTLGILRQIGAVAAPGTSARS